MTNLLSALAATIATSLHVNPLLGEGWNFPYASDVPPEAFEDPHFLVLTDGRRIDVLVRGDARDVTYYRPGEPGYAHHKAIAMRQGMETSGIDCPLAWEAQEVAALKRRSVRPS
jgi:hypothetical protein